MNPLKPCMMVLAACSLLPAGMAEPEQADPVALRLALDLVDGSHVIGTPAIESVSVRSTLAKIDIPLVRLFTIKMAEDHQNAVLDLQNGDQIKGVLDLEPIELETVFGKVTVGIEHLQTLRVVWIGGTPPAGEGPLALGGVNWTPWRTEFAVRGGKLVSLPA